MNIRIEGTLENMGKTVSFINRGLIDLRAIRTFGVSAKECENPIGFFGTGMKYAIAICLRLGCGITLYRGTARYVFKTAEISVRNSDFSVVTMNGEELGFTIDLGKKWEPWQAFRELYCNTLDEGGGVYGSESDPAEDHTTIVVTGDVFHAAYRDRHKIVLTEPPVWSNNDVNIHRQENEYGYFRGIRAIALKEPSVMTYNVTSALELTEDRTIKTPHEFSAAVRYAILDSREPEFIKAFLQAPEGSFEQQLDLGEWYTPSEMFLRTVEQMAFREISNMSAHRVYKKFRKRTLSPDPTPLNLVEKKQFERAVNFCERMGYPVREYEIVITTDLADRVLGQAYEGRIYIGRSAFAMGTKIVCGTLIEEFIHLRHKLRDESRGLQDHLLNALVSMGELALGEPV